MCARAGSWVQDYRGGTILYYYLMITAWLRDNRNCMQYASTSMSASITVIIINTGQTAYCKWGKIRWLNFHSFSNFQEHHKNFSVISTSG